MCVTGHHWRRAWPYWTAHLNGDPMLAAWLKTPEAFRPPKDWPVKGMPPQVTPRAFASCVLPSNEATDHGAILYHCPYLSTLAAWAHGWPVPKREWKHMRQAVGWLVENPVFLIWAYDLDVTTVPMPFGDVSLWMRLAGRARMEKDPLSVGNHSLVWSLPREIYKDTQSLMRLPRRSEGVAHSSKWPNLKPDLDSP